MKKILEKKIILLNIFSGIFISFLIHVSSALAVPPPPPVSELCQKAKIIVLGQELGGQVAEPQGCQFAVSFEVKPEKILKGKSHVKDLEKISYEKKYFLNLPWCSRVPGPNALPDQMKARFAKPPQTQKVYFIKINQEGKREIANYFYGEVDWKQSSAQWREEFKKTPACHDK